MTQREKLIDLLETIVLPRKEIYSVAEIADFMIDFGVLVMPCKVGDTVYDIYEAFNNGRNDVRALKVTDIHIHLDKRNKAWIIVGGYYFSIDDFDKTVFLAREEAEAALKKMEDEK